ncbi:MAG TPA: late competence development ComFB family protein [bacterium]|nr:late competence development ComFB family protein [bacterium]
MEEAVKNSLEELLSEVPYESMKLNEKEKWDIMAYALNHLPPRYIVTDKGHLYTRVNELKQQFKTDIVVELSKAIKHVKANPR